MSHDVNLRRNIDRHSIVFAAWHYAAAGGLSSLILVEELVSPGGQAEFYCQAPVMSCSAARGGSVPVDSHNKPILDSGLV